MAREAVHPLWETVGDYMATGGVKSERKSGLFATGPDARRGHGPAPGAPNAGRPASDIRELCRALIDKHDLMTKLAELAESAERDADKLAAMKLLMAYGHGQPTQVVEHTGKDGGPIEHLEHAKTDFESRISRITQRLGSAAMPEGID